MGTLPADARLRASLLSVLRARAIIAQRFASLLSRTALDGRALFKFARHRSTVSGRLKSSFELSQIIPIGSGARGSAIAQSSDLDLLVVLRRQEVTWGDRLMSSDSVLRNLRAELDGRFQQTELGKDGQAISVYFESGQYPVDVVPAAFSKMVQIGGRTIPVYIIPNGQGEWLVTSPAAHNSYIGSGDVRSGGKLKNVAKLIKYWRWCRTPEIPLNSFHVEMLLASENICAGVKTYPTCLAEALDKLAARKCRALVDPLGISGYIKAANTESKQERVVAAVADSAFHAGRAVAAERAGDVDEALRQWDIVFNGLFPRS